MTGDKIQAWLEAARWAASGGNAQPWLVHFDEKDGLIAFEISIDPQYQKHASVMDVLGSASAMALGCFAKNLMIAAQNDAYKLKEKKYFSKDSIWQSSVVLIFEPMTDSQNSYRKYSAETLLKRCTNRNLFKTEEIKQDYLNSVEQIFKKYPSISYSEIRHGNKNLISELSKIEKIRWINKVFLKSLLSEISFNLKEKSRLEGIPAEQLGVSFFDQKLLQIVKSFFNFGSLLFKIGLYRVPIKKNVSVLIEKCDRIFFLQAENLDFLCCFELGLCFQETWLELTDKQISFQPIGCGFIPLAYWHNQDSYEFDSDQMQLLEEVTHNCYSMFKFDFRKPVMGFRMGICDEKVEKSPRKPVKGLFKKILVNMSFQLSKVNSA